MHTIRLREPWQREWNEATNSAIDGRLARYHRYFHCPSGLADQQAVTLVLQVSRLVTSSAPLRHASTPPLNVLSLLLNSQPLQFDMLLENPTQARQLSVRIDSILKPYNQLEFLCEFPALLPLVDNDSNSVPLPPALADWAEVRIEIHD
ncbi:MAG: hypothetical protein ABI557_10185 [Aureliella sp.]